MSAGLCYGAGPGLAQVGQCPAFGREWQGDPPGAVQRAALRPWQRSETISDTDDRFDVQVCVYS